MKLYRHAGTVLPRVALLRFRPRQRIENLKFLFFTSQTARRFQRGTNFIRHRLDFIPRRRDQQRRLVLLQCFQIRTARRSREAGCREVPLLPPSVPIVRTLPPFASAPPVRRPCDSRPCVAAGCGSVGRIGNPNDAPKSAAHRHARPKRAGRYHPTAQCARLCAMSKSRFMSSMPTAPASSRTTR